MATAVKAQKRPQAKAQPHIVQPQAPQQEPQEHQHNKAWLMNEGLTLVQESNNDRATFYALLERRLAHDVAFHAAYARYAIAQAKEAYLHDSRRELVRAEDDEA